MNGGPVNYGRRSPPDPLALRVDACLQDGRWLEQEHTARRDLHLLTGLRIATQALASLADDEGPERGKSHWLAALETLLDFPKKGLDERGRLDARDMGGLIDGLSQMQPGNRFLDHIKARFTFDRRLRLDRCGSATLVANRGSSHPLSFVGRQRRRTTRGHDDIATRARGAPTRNRVPCTGGVEGEVIGHTFFQNGERAAQSCRFSTRASAHDSILAAD
jgi:hypothetical protein